MPSSRRTATVVGLLFLTQTAAFIIAEQLIGGVLKAPDYLTDVAGHANTLILPIWLLAKGFSSSAQDPPSKGAPQLANA